LPTLASLLLVVAIAAPLTGQSGWNTSRPQMTRGELTSLLERLETISQSSDQPAETRNEAQREALRLRTRLDEGDFRVGDQIDLRVEGEETLSQVFTLRPGPTLQLPGIGDVSLRGVLRSELQDHLSRAIGEYIRDPVVVAESTIRLTISGSVGTPGFHSVPPDRALTDAIMLAGGPSAVASLRGIYIERGGQQIWSGAYLQQAIADGRTLDQMSLQGGDHIVVPIEQPRAFQRYLPIWSGILSTVALVVTIMTRL